MNSSPPNASASPDADAQEVIIVGFGLAGATLATTLARKGRRVLVIERDEHVPERICGELLQPGGVRVLERLRLDSLLETAKVDAIPAVGYALLSPRGSSVADVLLSYPSDDPSNVAAWFGFGLEPRGKEQDEKQGGGIIKSAAPTGCSFVNANLVESIRSAALEAGVRVVWGSVSSLEVVDGRVVGVSYASRDGANAKRLEKAFAPLVVCCDGMYSLHRGSLDGGVPRTISAMAGLILSHPPNQTPLPHPHRGHVLMSSPNPVLFYQIGASKTRVLVDLPLSVYAAHGADAGVKGGALASYFTDVIAPQLPGQLKAHFERAVAEQEAELMPAKALPSAMFDAASSAPRGAVLLGDARSMRHPLTGGGMTVLLRDVELLTEALSDVANFTATHAVDAALATFTLSRKPHATTINVLANALHGVFTVPPVNANGHASAVGLRDACLAYLGLGGAASAGPIGLLAGLTPHPLVLILHFTAVAFYAVAREFAPSRFSIKSPWNAAALLYTAASIIVPLSYKEGIVGATWGMLPRRFNRLPFLAAAICIFALVVR